MRAHRSLSASVSSLLAGRNQRLLLSSHRSSAVSFSGSPQSTGTTARSALDEFNDEMQSVFGEQSSAPNFEAEHNNMLTQQLAMRETSTRAAPYVAQYGSPPNFYNKAESVAESAAVSPGALSPSASVITVVHHHHHYNVCPECLRKKKTF